MTNYGESNMKNPYLISIEPSQGLDEALIFIGGYLSEDNSSPEDNSHWWRNIRRSGWKGSIYYLWWDSSRDETVLFQSVILPVIGSIAHWEKHKRRARKVGKKFLPSMIQDLSESKVTLAGFSLGSRIIYYALRELKEWPKSSQKIDHAILMAGAIRRGSERSWSSITPQLHGYLINIFNENDSVLNTLFELETFARSACGTKPIKEYHPKIININATNLLNTHKHLGTKYALILPEILPHYL